MACMCYSSRSSFMNEECCASTVYVHTAPRPMLDIISCRFRTRPVESMVHCSALQAYSSATTQTLPYLTSPSTHEFPSLLATALVTYCPLLELLQLFDSLLCSLSEREFSLPLHFDIEAVSNPSCAG